MLARTRKNTYVDPAVLAENALAAFTTAVADLERAADLYRVECLEEAERARVAQERSAAASVAGAKAQDTAARIRTLIGG